MALAQSRIDTDPLKNLRWAEVREMRKLHEEQEFSIKRLMEIFEASRRQVTYALYERQHPVTVHRHHSIAQRKARRTRLIKKSKLEPSLWDFLCIMALKRKLPYRGFSPLEIVSTIKSYWHNPPSEAEREILDEVCARYGLTWDDVPEGKVRIHAL